MEGDDERESLLVGEGSEELKDVAAPSGIDGAEWLIGEKDFRALKEGAREGDALALTAGKRVGAVIHFFCDVEALK